MPRSFLCEVFQFFSSVVLGFPENLKLNSRDFPGAVSFQEILNVRFLRFLCKPAADTMCRKNPGKLKNKLSTVTPL